MIFGTKQQRQVLKVYRMTLFWVVSILSVFLYQYFYLVSQDKLKELEDGFFAVQAEQEAIALNASSPQVASEFLSDECKD